MLIINNKREVVVNLITIMQIDNKQSNTISYMQQQTPTTQLLNAYQYLAARCGCSFFSPLGADKHLNNTITHKVYA